MWQEENQKEKKEGGNTEAAMQLALLASVRPALLSTRFGEDRGFQTEVSSRG